MSLLQFTFESQYLCNNTTVSVILPDRPHSVDAADFYSNGKKYRVLWLLHGTYGDHSDWVRKSMIEIYAREKNLICVMPSGLNADYENWPGFGMGFDMDSFLVKELMPMIYNWFPASPKKEDNFIAGLSMGGRGALKYLLKYPDKFASGAILSAAPVAMDAIDWEGKLPPAFGLRSMSNPRFRNQVANAGGKEAYIRDYDLFSKVFEMHKAGALPKMIFGCGDKDFLYDTYKAFKDACLREEVPITFFELPNLGHEWRFWDPFIQEAFRFWGFETDTETKKLL